MTGVRSLVHIGLTGSRWLLPWMSILLASAAMTFAMNGALTGSRATPYWWPALSNAPAGSEVRATETVAYEESLRDHARLYASLPDSMLNTGISETSARHTQP